MTRSLSALPGDNERVRHFDLDETPSWRIREVVRELLAPAGGVIVEDAVAVVEELVANAHEHGSAPRRCRLVLQAAQARLRVEVDDSGAGDPYVRTPDRAGGRGMVLIDGIATAWGVIRYEGFKSVWAELPLDRPHFSPITAAP